MMMIVRPCAQPQPRRALPCFPGAALTCPSRQAVLLLVQLHGALQRVARRLRMLLAAPGKRGGGGAPHICTQGSGTGGNSDGGCMTPAASPLQRAVRHSSPWWRCPTGGSACGPAGPARPGQPTGVRAAQVVHQRGDKRGRQGAAGLLPQALRHLSIRLRRVAPRQPHRRQHRILGGHCTKRKAAPRRAQPKFGYRTETPCRAALADVPGSPVMPCHSGHGIPTQPQPQPRPFVAHPSHR